MNKWLRCEIGKGMFSDEVTVMVHDVGGASIAVFVPKSEVREDQKTVNVRAFEGGGKTMAVLPDESRTLVFVPASELQPA